MVTAAACPRLFDCPPLRDSEHYVETTDCLSAHLKASLPLQKKHKESSSSECDQKFLMHSQKYNVKSGSDMYVSRLSCVCTAVIMCQHHLRPSLPLQKKQKQRELVVHMRSASYHGWSRTQCVVVDVLSVGWCAKRYVTSVPVSKTVILCSLQKLLRKVCSGDHGRNQFKKVPSAKVRIVTCKVIV